MKDLIEFCSELLNLALIAGAFAALYWLCGGFA